MIRVGELPFREPPRPRPFFGAKSVKRGKSQRFSEIFCFGTFLGMQSMDHGGPFFGHWKKTDVSDGGGMQLPLATPRFSYNWLDL